ncbi:zinc-finger domain-containing protein [Candidatus Hepatincola sp. Pdp]
MRNKLKNLTFNISNRKEDKVMNKQLTDIITEKTIVSCDGDKESKHPKVYLKIQNTRAVCPYCSRVFVYQPNILTTLKDKLL